jgi:tRNA(Ile)-lysidine synthase
LCVSADTLSRFQKAIAQLTAGSAPDFRIGLAVSGGPDSLALLWLAQACFPGRIAAATVDHGLRAEAADEARYVAQICAAQNIPHRILTPHTPITGSIQLSARKARYGLLQTWADDLQCTYIATAHHADDQLETMLMRLARGSGVDGLSGVRAMHGRIIRPLLGFTKQELTETCSTAGITPIHDPSNDDTAYDRVVIRQWLASAPHPLSAGAANRSAHALAQASSALDWTAHHFAADRMRARGAGYTLDPHGLPRELQRRLLLIVFKEIEPDMLPRGDAIERVLDALFQGKKITLSRILCTGGALWHFGFAPARRDMQNTQ